MSGDADGTWVRRLLDVGQALTSELDEWVVLDRVLEAAREITGARYAAVGILNAERTELARFLTAGVDEVTHRSIGDLPRGRGVLGALIEHPQPLRVADVGLHPSSYGFPLGHPVMRSFLGVPVVIRGEVWGNLYLTEKAEGEFTEADEEAAVILAQWASIAIENARLYETSERRRRDAEKSTRGLEAIRDVVVAIGEEIALEHVLELIVKRGRALVNARSLVVMLRDGKDLVVHNSAGHVQEMRGVRLPVSGSTSGEVLERRVPERITDVASRLRIAPREFGVTDPQTALLVPMLYRGDAVGILAAFDHGSDGELFSDEDEQTLHTFAASAATAVALARSVQADRLRSSLASAEGERRRWARELHDETLQSLAALQVLISSALRRRDTDEYERTMQTAMAHIKREIENLRTIITELRPAALDELGLKTAIETLLDRHSEQSGLQITRELTLTDRTNGQAEPTVEGSLAAVPQLDRHLETAVYRLVQEALTNVVKHANAKSVRVVVGESDGELQIEVQDNGRGFDPQAASRGFGLQGMRERVSLGGGTLSITPSEHGTLVQARLPTGVKAGVEAELAAS